MCACACTPSDIGSCRGTTVLICSASSSHTSLTGGLQGSVLWQRRVPDESGAAGRLQRRRVARATHSHTHALVHTRKGKVKQRKKSGKAQIRTPTRWRWGRGRSGTECARAHAHTSMRAHPAAVTPACVPPPAPGGCAIAEPQPPSAPSLCGIYSSAQHFLFTAEKKEKNGEEEEEEARGKERERWKI